MSYAFWRRALEYTLGRLQDAAGAAQTCMHCQRRTFEMRNPEWRKDDNNHDIVQCSECGGDTYYIFDIAPVAVCVTLNTAIQRGALRRDWYKKHSILWVFFGRDYKRPRSHNLGSET